jgi:hypothetical protein
MVREAVRRWVLAVVALAACASPGRCSRSCGERNASKALGDEACAQWATHYCKRLESCAPISVSIDYGNVEDCIARNRPVCASALQAQATGATASTMTSCALAYDSASCDDVVVGKTPQACHAPGLLGAGAPCGDGSQCAGPQAYCRIAADETCGACAPLGDVGAACDSARDCRYGLVCYFSCLRPVPKGDTCDGMLRQCPETLVCLNYRCVDPAPRDAPCAPNADHCDHDRGLFCDPEEKVCSPYAVADVGAACGAGTICKRGACVPDETTAVSRCVASVPDGASCDAIHGPTCLAPSKCVSGQCRAPRATTCL